MAPGKAHPPVRPELRHADRLRRAAALVLLAGILCAAYVYATSPNSAGDAVGYVSDMGGSYAVEPTDSRSFTRGLEFYGGKSAVLMLELRQWFAGLLQGTPLALVIAGAAFAVAGGCLFAARRIEEDLAEDETGGGR